MAELFQSERLSPSLLDRLTDYEPESRFESVDNRAISVDRLRTLVLRDLEWLFNTVHLEANEDLEEYPEIAASTLNYGVLDMAGKTLAYMPARELQRRLREAILRYEPRLIRSTVQVTVVPDEDKDGHRNLAFEIEAQLWCQPVPMRLMLRSDIDLDTGTVTVTEQEGE